MPFLYEGDCGAGASGLWRMNCLFSLHCIDLIMHACMNPILCASEVLQPGRNYRATDTTEYLAKHLIQFY